MTLRKTQAWLGAFMISYLATGMVLTGLTIFDQQVQYLNLNILVATMMLASVIMFYRHSRALLYESSFAQRKAIIALRWNVTIVLVPGLLINLLDWWSSTVEDKLMMFIGGFLVATLVAIRLANLMLVVDDSLRGILNRKRSS